MGCLNTSGLQFELEEHLTYEKHLKQFLQYAESFPSKTGRLCALSILCTARFVLAENGGVCVLIPYVSQVYRIMGDSDPEIVKKISLFLSYYIYVGEEEPASETICHKLISQGIFTKLYELSNSDEKDLQLAALYLARAFTNGLFGKFVLELIDAGLMPFVKTSLHSAH